MGILDEDKHKELIRDIERFADIANIAVLYIEQSAKKWCTEQEIDWVRKFRQYQKEGVCGLVITSNEENHSIETRMMALVGLCLRNYIDARFYTVHSLLASMKHGKAPDPTVMFIPNFYMSKDDGGDIASWLRTQMLDLLYDRQSKGHMTVLYVSDMNMLEMDCGSTLATYLQKNYTII